MKTTNSGEKIDEFETHARNLQLGSDKLWDLADSDSFSHFSS
jgi:hypothetical protein